MNPTKYSGQGPWDGARQAITTYRGRPVHAGDLINSPNVPQGRQSHMTIGLFTMCTLLFRLRETPNRFH